MDQNLIYTIIQSALILLIGGIVGLIVKKLNEKFTPDKIARYKEVFMVFVMAVEQIVLHELCHCITRHLRAVFMDMAIRHVKDEILRCEIIQRFNDQEEALVGKLSHILYDFLERGESVGPGSLPSEFPKKANKK